MIIPSIDIMNGKVVQLRQGKEKLIELEEDPVEFACKFSKLPAVQVIDLDAALGKGDNSEIIKDICRVANVRVGGGIKSLEKASQVLGWGAKKVIVGSKAKPKFIARLSKEIGADYLHRSN